LMRKIVLPSLFDRRDGLTDVMMEYVILVLLYNMRPIHWRIPAVNAVINPTRRHSVLRLYEKI
jgi:hypothetical protein